MTYLTKTLRRPNFFAVKSPIHEIVIHVESIGKGHQNGEQPDGWDDGDTSCYLHSRLQQQQTSSLPFDPNCFLKTWKSFVINCYSYSSKPSFEWHIDTDKVKSVASSNFFFGISEIVHKVAIERRYLRVSVFIFLFSQRSIKRIFIAGKYSHEVFARNAPLIF